MSQQSHRNALEPATPPAEPGVPTQDWLARGLKSPAGRGWDDAPLSDAEVNAKLAEYGVALRPSAGDKPWPGGWVPGDPPVQIVCDADHDPYAHIREFDREARVRFLDCLADSGNVSKAAIRVGVSRETAYRARRRHADFARVWDAALVHAKARAEAELTTRALDGVAVPVIVRGEHVATLRKHDARYLLAHLGRLDKRIEEDPAAVQRAGHFEELLAAMAGHEAPEDFAEAVHSARRDVDEVTDTPPTCEEYTIWARSEALSECRDADDWETEDRAMTKAGRAARKRWEAWKAAGALLLEKVLAGPEKPGKQRALDTVTSVNTPCNRGA